MDLPRLALPLADLHSQTTVAAQVRVVLDGTLGDADVARLIEGAGFDVLRRRRDGGGWNAVLQRQRTLPDLVGPGMGVLVCGLNPSLFAADTGVAFGRPGNRFWPAALAAGLVHSDREPRQALIADGVGWTDLCKRATVGAAEVTPAEYRHGLARLTWVASTWTPRVICVVGLAGWRVAVDRATVPGLRPERLGPAWVYVMPNTSGLNAHSTLADFTTHLRAVRTLAGST